MAQVNYLGMTDTLIQGAVTPQRETEVSRQLYRLNDTAIMLDNTVGELMSRLSPVLVPKEDKSVGQNQIQAGGLISAPLASNIGESINKLLEVEKKLRFIMDSLEI